MHFVKDRLEGFVSFVECVECSSLILILSEVRRQPNEVESLP
jgi:hypothetical protein